MKNKNHKTNIVIIVLFIITAVTRFTCANYNKLLMTYPDELRYFSIARSLFMYGDVEIYSYANSFQKILYSIIISPAFQFDNVMTQVHIIALINSVLVALGLFPVYFLAKKYIKSSHYLLIICLVYITSSDLCYSCTFMSENLFLPMGLLAVLLFSFEIENCFDNVPTNNRWFGYLKSVVLGAYIWFLYLCKEIAAVFVIAYFLYIVIMFFIKKKIFRSAILKFVFFCLGFILPFIIAKLTIFSGYGNSYNQQSADVLENHFNFFFADYSFFYYLLMVLLAYSILPFILTIIGRNTVDSNAKQLFAFLCLLLILSLGTITYTITIREDFGSTLPRIHLRYICYLYLPFIIIMYHTIEKGKLKANKISWGVLLGFIAWLYYYFLFEQHILATTGELVDQTMLSFLSLNASTGYQLIVISIYAVITVMCFYGITHNKKYGLMLLTSFIIVLGTTNSIIMTATWRNSNFANDRQVAEMDFLHDLDKENSDATFLVIQPCGNSKNLIDMGMQEHNVYQVRMEDVRQYILENRDDKELLWSKAASSLRNIRFGDTYDSLDKVDYIIFEDMEDVSLDASQCTLVESPMQGPVVYKINDPYHIPDMVFHSISILQDSLDEE